MASAAIRRIRVVNFKAFEDFRTTFVPTTVRVGPNNAGKTTLVAALRTASNMIRHAQRRKPTRSVTDRDRHTVGHDISAEKLGLVDENLRHEFRESETRLEVAFRDDCHLVAVWPSAQDGSGDSPFYYLHSEGRPLIRTPAQAKRYFPRIAAIRTLSPLEQSEQMLTEDYVRKNIGGPMTSRHFRNQLWLMKRDIDRETGTSYFDRFVAFAHTWTPELELTDLRVTTGQKGAGFDLFYKEPGARTEREIFWAGDGMQIWLQLLLHLYQNNDVDALVLDEPDVFLHGDLQRRLVRLLDGVGSQVITATHSAEVLAEIDPSAITWIDKSRRTSIRAPKPEQMGLITHELGTSFNLRLARALRSTVVVFVEGDDMRIIRNLAETVGASRFQKELGVAVVPLQGFSNWEHVEPFAWMTQSFLDESVEVYVLLDRDYRQDEACRDVEGRLAALGVHGHVWSRKELENFLLVPAAIARVSGAPVGTILELIVDVTEDMKYRVASQILSETKDASSPSLHLSTIAEKLQKDFDRRWPDLDFRLIVCPGKAVLSGINRRLQEEGFKPTSAVALARALRVTEIPQEVAAMLSRVELSIRA